MSLTLYARSITYGKEYCATFRAEGIGGRRLRYVMYKVDGGRTVEVLNRTTCGLGRVAPMAISFPGPGDYMLTVMDDGPCTEADMVEKNLITVKMVPMVYTSVLSVYICLNSPDGTCDEVNADFSSLVKPDVEIPVAFMPAKRITINLMSYSPATAVVKAGGVEVGRISGNYPASIDLEGWCEADLPPIAVPPQSLSTFSGLFYTLGRVYIWGLTAGLMAGAKSPYYAIFMFFITPILDQMYVAMFSNVRQIPPGPLSP